MEVPLYIATQVNTNGLISVDHRETLFAPRHFPTNNVIIAPFWADADTRSAGTVSYGSNRDRSVLARAAEQIRVVFPEHSSFSPSYLFIVTWNGIGYYNRKGDLVRIIGLKI